MTGDLIRLVVEPARSTADAVVPALAFADQLRLLVEALARTEKVVFGAVRIEWALHQLSSASPRRAVLAPRYLKPTTDPEYIPAVESRFFDIVESIQERRTLTPDLRRADIDVFRKLGGLVRAGQIQVTILNGNRSVQIDSSLELNAVAALAPETRSIGTTQGRLERANVHDAHHFYLYPWIGPTSIRCAFDDALTEKVGHALGKWVTVSGEHVYPALSADPEIIYAYDVVPLEDEASAPTLTDLRGIAQFVPPESEEEDDNLAW